MNPGNPKTIFVRGNDVRSRSRANRRVYLSAPRGCGGHHSLASSADVDQLNHLVFHHHTALHHVETVPVQARASWSVFMIYTEDALLSDVQFRRRIRRRQVQVISLSCPSQNTCSSSASLVLRFVKDQFDDYRESTIGGTLVDTHFER